MAFAILRCEIPDDDEQVAVYGIGQIADALAEDAAGGYTGWTSIEVVEVEGPDNPTECYRCGCDYHDDAPCACGHPFCRSEQAS